MQDAFALDDLVVVLESFTADAIPALIRFLVEVSGRVLKDSLDQSADSLMMARLCGAHELIIGDRELAPHRLKSFGDLVDQNTGRHAAISGFGRDFLSVLVHTDQKKDVVTAKPAISGKDVGADLFESANDGVFFFADPNDFAYRIDPGEQLVHDSPPD